MKNKHPIDYSKPKVRREILIRQRRNMWTPEQVASLAGHFRLRPGLALLDAGCGYGYALRTWGRFCLPGGDLVGFDRDKSLLAAASRYCRKEGFRSARFVRGDICAMPFADGEFDVALASVVLCHLAEPEKALDEMIRVTRPGGCVAVFDNAQTSGGGSGWNNALRPTVRERVVEYEVGIRALAGRKKLGFGDFSVGCYLPGWMEARGLKDVDVRTNELVYWVAPPYRSAGQRTSFRNLKERMAENRGYRLDASQRRQMEAGGCSRPLISRVRRYGVSNTRRFRKAFRAGTLALAWSTQFWCVWGFKP